MIRQRNIPYAEVSTEYENISARTRGNGIYRRGAGIARPSWSAARCGRKYRPAPRAGLGNLERKPTDLERYVYLIRLCDRDETLLYKVLMSEWIRFLLASDCRRSLLEIWLHLPSLVRLVRFDPSQRRSRGGATRGELTSTLASDYSHPRQVFVTHLANKRNLSGAPSH